VGVTKYFITLKINAGRQGMPVSLGWESSTSTFISGANSFMIIHETVDQGHRPNPSLARDNLYRKDQMHQQTSPELTSTRQTWPAVQLTQHPQQGTYI